MSSFMIRDLWADYVEPALSEHLCAAERADSAWNLAGTDLSLAVPCDAWLIIAVLIVPVQMCVVLLTVFYASCVEHRSWAAPYRVIPADKWPSKQLSQTAWLQFAFDNAVSSFLAIAGVCFAATQGMIVVRTSAIPSDLGVVWHVVAAFLLSDATFYALHRTLHEVKWLYKHVHKKHHQFYTTTAIATNYAHPAEQVANAATLLIGPYVLAMHPLVASVYLVLRVSESIDAHSGYALPFSIWALPFFRQAEHHAFHHSENVGCFGVFAGLTWDELFGTNRLYKEKRKRSEAKLGQTKLLKRDRSS